MFASAETLVVSEKDVKAGMDEKSHDSNTKMSALESFKHKQDSRIAKSERDTKARVEAREVIEGFDHGFVGWVMAAEQQPGVLKITSFKLLRQMVLIWKAGKDFQEQFCPGVDASECDTTFVKSDAKAFLERMDKIFLDWDKYKADSTAKDVKPPKSKYCHVLLTFGVDGASYEVFDETIVSHSPCGPKCNIDRTMQVWSDLPLAGRKEARKALEFLAHRFFGKWQVHAAWTIQDKPRHSSGIRKLLQRVVLGPEMLMASRAANTQGVMVVFVAHEDKSDKDRCKKPKKPIVDPLDELDLLLGLQPAPSQPPKPYPSVPAPPQAPEPYYAPSPYPEYPHQPYHHPAYYGPPNPYAVPPPLSNPFAPPQDPAPAYYYPPPPPHDHNIPPQQAPTPYDPNIPPHYAQMPQAPAPIPYERLATPPPPDFPNTPWNPYTQSYTNNAGPGDSVPRFASPPPGRRFSPPPLPRTKKGKKAKKTLVPEVINNGAEEARRQEIGDLAILADDQAAPSSITQVD